jgi:hypothetical protein
MASKKKNILIATIGTRDLAFQVSSGEWLSVGNDRMNQEQFSHQGQILLDLNLDPLMNFRELSELLLASWDDYDDRLQPIVLGKLIADEAKNFSHIYLIATDQNEGVKQRVRDTLYAAEIISKWIAAKYAVPTTILLQGTEGDSPANFEQMFAWWQQTWEQIETNSPEFQYAIVSPKGGVGAFTEAARIVALSRLEQRVRFCDFTEDEEANLKGEPSPYTVPSRGLNYLWDRKRKESIELLNRYDYEAVQRLLKSYLPEPQFAEVRSALEAAVYWNQGGFVEFAKAPGAMAKGRSSQWWWIGYEVAYLAVIRLRQGHTAEAMFHSFRSVEGLMKEFVFHKYSHHVIGKGKSAKLKKSICQEPDFAGCEYLFVRVASALPNRYSSIFLFGNPLVDLFKLARPDFANNRDIQICFGDTKNSRNKLFHGLEGLERQEVFENWGCNNLEGWESRVLGCLNFMTGQEFDRLQQASLMSKVHQVISDGIGNYQPER